MSPWHRACFSDSGNQSVSQNQTSEHRNQIMENTQKVLKELENIRIVEERIGKDLDIRIAVPKRRFGYTANPLEDSQIDETNLLCLAKQYGAATLLDIAEGWIAENIRRRAQVRVSFELGHASTDEAKADVERGFKGATPTAFSVDMAERYQPGQKTPRFSTKKEMATIAKSLKGGDIDVAAAAFASLAKQHGISPERLSQLISGAS